MLIWSLLSCAASSLSLDDGPAAPEVDHVEGADDIEGADDSGGDTGATPGGEDAEAVPGAGGSDEADWIFSFDRVHTLEIEVSMEGVAGLQNDPWTYVEGSIVFDDVPVDQVGVRLKGAWGSFQEINSKSNFKIDFNRYVDGQTFAGLEQFTLNNNVVDCSFLREHLGYMVFSAAGMPETRTAYVWVTFNGEEKGLYSLIETPDDVWMERTFDDPSGNLYDGKYILAPDWSWYSRVDFTIEQQDDFELEEGEDVGLEDIYGVTSALNAAWLSADGYAELGEVIDWDSFQTNFAAEHWAGQNDGYFTNDNNFRIYFDPATGRAQILPWDMDYSFLYASEWGMSWTSPMGVIAQFCRYDTECWQDQVDRGAEVFERIDAADLGARVEELSELILPYAVQDPYRCGDESTIVYYQNALRTWMNERTATARGNWGL